MKAQKIQIGFKNPDFDSELLDAGVEPKAVSRLRRQAEFGEYWTLELTMDGSGNGEIASAKFVRTK